MRYLLVLLLALAPFGAPSATVSVTGSMPCGSASSISYNLDTNRMSFFCNMDSLTYSCNPTNVDYGTGTQIIDMTCATGTGSTVGLQVSAIMDDTQNGNGNSDGICNNANTFAFHVTERRYTWTCNNGNGNTKTVSCWTSTVPSKFDIGANAVTLDCVTLLWRSDFEDFEPSASEYDTPHLE